MSGETLIAWCCAVRPSGVAASAICHLQACAQTTGFQVVSQINDEWAQLGSLATNETAQYSRGSKRSIGRNLISRDTARIWTRIYFSTFYCATRIEATAAREPHSPWLFIDHSNEAIT